MSKFNFQKAIYKYAILLTIYYLINLVWALFFHGFLSKFMFEGGNPLYDDLTIISWIISIIFNVLFAVLVYKDLKINKIKSPLIVVITLCFGFLGIALFFIQVLYSLYLRQVGAQQNL